MAYGLRILNNSGQVAFDVGLGFTPVFLGKYTGAAAGEVSFFVTSAMPPIPFVENTGVGGGGAIVTSIRSTGTNTWEIRASGEYSSGTFYCALYLFGAPTSNNSMTGYGMVIKNPTPGGLDYFDARNRILRIEATAFSTSASGNILTDGTPNVGTTGAVPDNWAVCTGFPPGHVFVQVSSQASLGFFTCVRRTSALTVTFAQPTSFASGAVAPVAARGGYNTYPGFPAYFINTNLYQ